MLVPGKRTGTFRLGSDTLVMDKNGESRISMEDFAVAMLDEEENANTYSTSIYRRILSR